MKLIELLRKELPDFYFEAAINNISASELEILENEAEDIQIELIALFDWETSNEGYDFWNAVLECIEKGVNLPSVEKSKIVFAPGTTIFNHNSVMIFNLEGADINIKYPYAYEELESIGGILLEKYSTWVN
tara:strand:- start:8800 stop:9192 length:393 start_codon:yes stop_codon:yes gene_type:complete